ncbi:unnamed protein product [Mucor hiemalis]
MHLFCVFSFSLYFLLHLIMTGSNISNDPFGCRLPSCNDYSSPPPKADPPKKVPPKKPVAAVPAVQYCSYNFYPQPQFYMVAPAPPAKPKAKKPKPPAHVCVNCSAKNKCKACKKKEDEGKKWVYNPTFSNPRTPRKSVFS